MRLFKIFSIFILLMATAVYYHEHSSRYQTISGKIFGTYYNIKINTLNKNNKLENKVKVVLNEVNAAMSMFDPESEISRINRETSNRPLKLAPSLGYLLQNAAKVYAESNGAFDPTVARWLICGDLASIPLPKRRQSSRLPKFCLMSVLTSCILMIISRLFKKPTRKFILIYQP